MAATEPVKRFTPQEVVAKLDSQFEKARESGDLFFFPSTVHKHTDAGIDVRFLLFSPFPRLGPAVSEICRMLERLIVFQLV